MTRVDLSTRDYDGQVVVELRGELDIAGAASVATVLTGVVTRQPKVIVDLADLEFIDSSGLAALAHARKRARDAGGEVVLAGPQRQVARVLALTRLIDAFSVHASVDEAAGRAKDAPPVIAPVAAPAAPLSVT
jgi:anti-sigma B factor antagonist